jgi:hypothetical protein
MYILPYDDPTGIETCFNASNCVNTRTVHLLVNYYKLEKIKGNAIPVQDWTALRVPGGSGSQIS